jgi:uncharacterized protein
VRSSTRIVAVLVVLVLVIGGAVAGAYLLLKPSSSGGSDPGIPKLDHYATDLAGAISSDDLYWIGEVCHEVDTNSSCEMAVVVVNTTQPYEINYFALRTFQYNQIGKAGKDNGVLVVVATDDDTWRIEVGYGLEGILTDVRVKHLAQEFLEPNMTAGSYGNGLFELTAAMGDILENEYQGDRSGTPAFQIFGVSLSWVDLAIIAVIVIVASIVTRGRVLFPIIWILSLLGGRGGGGFGGGRSGGGGASGGR